MQHQEKYRYIHWTSHPITDTHLQIIWINWLCEITEIFDLMQKADQAFKDLTAHTIRGTTVPTHLFFPTAWEPCPVSLTWGDGWNKSSAPQRCRPQVWTGVWVHWRSGMGAGPGAQLRGVALTCPPPPPLCVETLKSQGRQAREEGGATA